MKILSISIAAYNVEAYLEQTLNSLCDERFIDDIEIMVIDDGSKDRTQDIAKKYEHKYPQSVKYVGKENGGHGSTINKGIETAAGKYFRVIDGDDYVDPDAFYRYLEKLKSVDTDMVISNYCLVDNEGNRSSNTHDIFSKVVPDKEYRISEINDSSFFGLDTISIQTKLLKESGVHITEKCYYVDVEYVVWCIYLAKNLFYVDEKVYMYRCISTTQNSVNPANMLRNVGMQQTVALNLCEILEKIELDSSISEGVRNLILSRIKMSVRATIRTFYFYQNSKDSKKSIISFDKLISEKSHSVFSFVGTDRLIRCSRMLHYSGVPLIHFLYKLRNGR